MINYIEKGYSMHQWLVQHGVELSQRDGVWIANIPDEQVNQLIADYNPWPAEKAAKLLEVNESFSDAISKLTEGTTQAERDSWSIQEAEARGYPGKPAARLEILASSRGITIESLVQKVLAKSDLYAQHYFTMQGRRDALEDVVKSLPDSGDYHRLPELWAIKFGS